MNNSIIIETRNFLVKYAILDASQTINQKIISLLNIFLDKKPYRKSYLIGNDDGKITIIILDRDNDSYPLISDTPMEIYRFLLEAFVAIYNAEMVNNAEMVMPSTKTKDMLCERIYSRYGMKAVSISVVKKYGKNQMRYELSSAGVRAEIDYSGERLGATIRSETC